MKSLILLTNSETTNPKLHQFFSPMTIILFRRKKHFLTVSLKQNTIFIIQRIKQGKEICFLPGCKYLIQNAKIGFVCIEIRAGN